MVMVVTKYIPTYGTFAIYVLWLACFPTRPKLEAAHARSDIEAPMHVSRVLQFLDDGCAAGRVRRRLRNASNVPMLQAAESTPNTAALHCAALRVGVGVGVISDQPIVVAAGRARRVAPVGR
ncbi:hypothetical protein CIB48_g1881 [Xylaria polymorpha]|nr:hypothetical protein CIB48_g1881 [Xylaria polymorpha]